MATSGSADVILRSMVDFPTLGNPAMTAVVASVSTVGMLRSCSLAKFKNSSSSPILLMTDTMRPKASPLIFEAFSGGDLLIREVYCPCNFSNRSLAHLRAPNDFLS